MILSVGDTIFMVVLGAIVLIGLFSLSNGPSGKASGQHFQMGKEKFRNKIMSKKKKDK